MQKLTVDFCVHAQGYSPERPEKYYELNSGNRECHNDTQKDISNEVLKTKCKTAILIKSCTKEHLINICILFLNKFIFIYFFLYIGDSIFV